MSALEAEYIRWQAILELAARRHDEDGILEAIDKLNEISKQLPLDYFKQRELEQEQNNDWPDIPF